MEATGLTSNSQAKLATSMLNMAGSFQETAAMATTFTNTTKIMKLGLKSLNSKSTVLLSLIFALSTMTDICSLDLTTDTCTLCQAMLWTNHLALI